MNYGLREMPVESQKPDATYVEIRPIDPKLFAPKYLYNINPNELKSIKSLLPDLTSYYNNQEVKAYGEFMAWVDKNDALLTEEFKKSLRNGIFDVQIAAGSGRIDFSKAIKKTTIDNDSRGQLGFICGLWLGERYLVSLNRTTEGGKIPKITMLVGLNPDPLNFVKYEEENRRLYFGQLVLYGMKRENAQEAFIVGFNLGLRETTRAIPRISGYEYNRTLSDLAAYYSQSRYGLPLSFDSISVSNRFSASKMDFANILEEIKGRNASTYEEKLLGESVAFMVLPWIKRFFESRGKEFRIFDYVAEPQTGWFSDLFNDPAKAVRALLPDNRENVTRSSIFSFLGIGHYEIDANGFFETQGIADGELKTALSEVFKKINAEKNRDASSFLKSLNKNMTEVFGEPKKEDAPEGFVLHESPAGGRVTPSSVPKKKKIG
jgi:hypothetical protein